MMMCVEKERQTDKRLLLCGRPAGFCVWRNAHNCSLSGVLLEARWSVCPLRLTPLFTSHTHTHTHTRQGAQKHRHTPLPTPSRVHEEKFPSVRFVTAGTKTSLSEGRRGMEEERGGRREEGGGRRVQAEERGCFICLKWDWGRGVVGAFPSPRLRAKDAAGTERRGREKKGKRDAADMLRHAIRER